MPHVAILGAGPIGLEAGLAAAERGLGFTVYEAAPQAAGHVRDWGHVRLFTPWDMNVSERVAHALGDSAPTGSSLPTGDELATRLLDPVAALPAIAPRLRLGTRVEAIGREGLLKHEEIATEARGAQPFRLLVRGPDGEERIEHADTVLDCTGTYGNPNALGDGGIPAPGERAHAGRIERRLPSFTADPARWAGRTILLTGAGHSAQTAARGLAALARDADSTRVIWAVRDHDPDWYTVAEDPLPERASLSRTSADLARGASPAVELRAGRVTEALRSGADGRVAVTMRNGMREDVEVDAVLALNGAVGDFTLYRQLQIHECYATGAPMKLSAALLAQSGAAGDCLSVEPPGPETLANPEPGFFILGAKSYGRNSQFLLRHGWQQVDDAFSLLA